MDSTPIAIEDGKQKILLQNVEGLGALRRSASGWTSVRLSEDESYKTKAGRSPGIALSTVNPNLSCLSRPAG